MLPARLALIGTLAATLSLVGQARAALGAVVEFDDRALFEATATVTEMDDFEDLSGFAQPNPLVRGSVSYTSTDGSGLYNSSGFNLPGNYLASQNSGGLLIEVAGGAAALGMDVADLWGNATLNYTLNGAQDVLETGTLAVGNAFAFLGFTSTESIFSLELTFAGGPGNFEAIDNLAVGAEGVSPVPLPAGLGFLIAGVAAFGAVRRKRG